MANRRALLGMVARCVHEPPTRVCRSTTATDLPCLAACIAAPSPPGPVPITMTSKWGLSITVISDFGIEISDLEPGSKWSKRSKPSKGIATQAAPDIRAATVILQFSFSSIQFAVPLPQPDVLDLARDHPFQPRFLLFR